MEGGDSEAHSPGLVVARFRSFRLRPCAVVFVRGVVSVLVRGRLSWFAGSCLRSWAGFMSWVFVIRAWGSSSSALSVVGTASLCVGGGARSRAVYIVRGWGLDGRGLWLSYTRGVRAVVGHCGVGWRLFRHGVVVVCRVVVVLHRSYGCHVALWATWPLYPGVRRGWRKGIGTYVNEHDGDDASSPSG